MIDQTFERTATLRDGRAVRLRAIRPSDEAALREGFARLSRLSRYRRFHGTFNELPSTVVHALTHVDGIDHCAVVAIDASPGGAERGLGVARFVRVAGQPERAELALTIADDVQGLGLGTRLLRLLGELAQERGVETFVAYVLRDNAQARVLFERAGAERVRGVQPQLTYELKVARLLQARRGLAA